MTTAESATAQCFPGLPALPAGTPFSGTHSWLTENPHQGVAASGTEGYRRLLPGNLLNAQGNRDCLYDSGIRSRYRKMYSYVGNNPLAYIDPGGACDVFINGIRQNPGDNATVDAFGKNLITVFPFTGTNYLTGPLDTAFGSADVAAAKAGLEAGLAQTPTGQRVNVTTISGGSGAFGAAYSLLTQDQRARIGNINYLIPGNGPIQWAAGLPEGHGTVNYVAGTGLDRIVPSGSPAGNFNRISSACGHDPACVLAEQAALLKSSQNGCPSPKVTMQKTIGVPPPAQPQSSGFNSFWNPHLFDWLGLILGAQGTSSSTITYDLP